MHGGYLQYLGWHSDSEALLCVLLHLKELLSTDAKAVYLFVEISIVLLPCNSLFSYWKRLNCLAGYMDSL